MAWHGTHPYPLQPMKDRYVSPFSGLSYELAPFEVGVNATALETNTRLAFDARVLVLAGDRAPFGGCAPALTRVAHRVVPLDASRPDALRLSPHGEVVFSTFESEHDASLLPWLRPGDPVVLNAALARFPADLRRPGEAI